MHLFIIHSPLMLRLASRIIESFQIPEEDVLLIALRGMKAACQVSRFKVIDMIAVDLVPDFSGTLDLSERLIALETSGKAYTAYIPHLVCPYSQILVLSNSCINYWQIEEGIGSYRQQKISSYKCSLIRFLQDLPGRVLGYKSTRSTKMYHFCDTITSKFRGAIAAYELAFPWIDKDKKRIVAGPLFVPDAQHEGSCVVLVEHVVPTRAGPEVASRAWYRYGKLLGDALNKTKEENSFSNYYIKPHATIEDSSYKLVLAGIDAVSDLKIKKLSTHLCVEEICLAKNSLVIGVYSSVLFYVMQQGGACRNLYNEIVLMDDCFQSRLATVPREIISLLSSAQSTLAKP